MSLLLAELETTVNSCIKKRLQSTWVAQSVEHPTLDFGSGHDIMVCDIEPHVRILNLLKRDLKRIDYKENRSLKSYLHIFHSLPRRGIKKIKFDVETMFFFNKSTAHDNNVKIIFQCDIIIKGGSAK